MYYDRRSKPSRSRADEIYVTGDTTGMSGEIPERCLMFVFKTAFRLIEIPRPPLFDFGDDTNFYRRYLYPSRLIALDRDTFLIQVYMGKIIKYRQTPT